MRLAHLAVLALLTLVLAGCAKPKDQIIGKWEVQDGEWKGKTLEFTKEGVVRIPLLPSVVKEYKYQFVSDDALEIEMPVFLSQDLVKKNKYTVAFQKDQMTATDDKGKAMQMKRVQ